MKVRFVWDYVIVQIIVFWFMFALNRLIFNTDNYTFINNRNNHGDADLMTTLYYTMGVHVVMGTGDVMPTSPLSRLFATLHMLIVRLLGTDALMRVALFSETQV